MEKAMQFLCLVKFSLPVLLFSNLCNCFFFL
uniref:Uncharacterized protein n=1 Tax=Anguilla anguilla TaxID=7936 RepID=A0A0E9UNE5_ANGAN